MSAVAEASRKMADLREDAPSIGTLRRRSDHACPTGIRSRLSPRANFRLRRREHDFFIRNSSLS